MQKQFKIWIIGLSLVLILFTIACEDDFEEIPNEPKVETVDVNVVNGSTVIASGGIVNDGGSSIEERGICIGTSEKPTIDDLKLIAAVETNQFETETSELSASTVYYARAYARNSFGIGYGNMLTFNTPNGMPMLETIAIDSITSNTAKGYGVVIDSGGFKITRAGVCWDTLAEPEIDNSFAYDSVVTDSFAVDLTNLHYNKLYYARAFAENENGVSYGESIEFTTNNGLPTVTTANISNATAISVTSGGEVTDENGYQVTARGVCWSNTPNPDLTNAHTENGTGTGTFVSQVEGLEVDQTYYLRAYATNEAGTAYGNELNFTTNSLGITLTTSEIVNITAISAQSGATIENTSAFEITDKGLCINTTGTPTMQDIVISSGSGNESFNQTITDLAYETDYFVRAFATNQAGTAYGNELSFITLDGIPELTTFEVTDITPTDAMGSGQIDDLEGLSMLEKGLCWNTNGDPAISDDKIESTAPNSDISGLLSPLNLSTTYFVRTYTTTEAGTGYGNEVSFTVGGLPAIEITGTSNITGVGFSVDGTVSSDGGFPVLDKGVCWSTSQNPDLDDNTLSAGNGTDAFTLDITGLDLSTSYYVRSYAENDAGISYSAQITVTTTNGYPELSTNSISNITGNSATSGGQIQSNGGFTISAQGVCWSTSENPTISNAHTTQTAGSNSFTSQIINLDLATTYFVRAYATNETGTAYGQSESFITDDGVISLTTTTATNILAASFESGGSIIDAGGLAVTEKGLCWSTSIEPTIADNFTTEGSSSDDFTTQVTDLNYATTYYVRAYATNANGTFYGNEIEVLTDDGIIQLTTAEITNITGTSANSGGNITDNGGLEITARGVCWSENSNPTLNDSYTIDGVGSGIFISDITGLEKGTVYFVKAYAINAVDTSYGNTQTFTTEAPDGPGAEVIDIDGNIYSTVWIGGQNWMAENLKTHTYNNSVPIELNYHEWDVTTTGAYTWYDNSSTNEDSLGCLYNWYAVETNNLCPDGWHVPSVEEWNQLRDYVGSQGYSGEEGTALKSINGWWFNNSSIEGVDAFGFNAGPTGYRSDDGVFSSPWSTYFWTNEGGASSAESKYISHLSSELNETGSAIKKGYSIRCIKD